MTATPFLMFQGGVCEAAIDLYVATLPDSRLVTLQRHAEGPAAGTVAMARIVIAGLEVMANDSPIPHAFDFTPSLSLFVDLDTEAEVDRIAGALSEGGKVLMAVGDYGFSKRFAWVADRFGVSWQLNLPS